MEKQTKYRTILFVIFIVIFLTIFLNYLKELYNLSTHRMTYSHIILIPFISGYFMFAERKKIFSKIDYSPWKGFILIFAGILFFFIGQFFKNDLSQNDFLCFIIFAGYLSWTGGCIGIFGTGTFLSSPFPFLFLLFMIPIPEAMLNLIISIFQKGSAEVANILFLIIPISFVRDGYTFHLPEISIEVAKECSGIFSGTALFITSTIAGHMFLKTGWNKVLLCVCAVPITIFKNGIRITTLSLFGSYVNKDILSGNLHRQGGKPFFLLALLLLFIVLWFIRRSEHPKKQSVK